MPARPIIIGRKFVSSTVGGRSYEYALLADVPAARVPYYAGLAAVSRIREVVAGDGGSTAAEQAAVANGQVLEYYAIGDWDNVAYPTVAAIQAELQLRQAAWQVKVNSNSIDTNPWANYGTSWNGTAWTTKVVA